MSTLTPNSLTQLPEEANRRFYSRAELQNYFTRINLPQKHLDSSILADSTLARTKEHGLPLLEALCRHHTTNIPFENLVLHYSTTKKVVLGLPHLYTWFVTKRRGGRCMENNSFFGTVLRSLGYKANTYDGLNHMLNLVRLENEWYVVDVGMGAMGPNLPYPLRQNFSTTSIAPRKLRIQYRAINESYAAEEEAPKLWCYDVCYDPTHAEEGNTWIPIYCFTEMEFLPQDYEVMSWFTSTHANSFFTRYMTATRMIMDAEKETIVGSVTLFKDTIREQRGSEREVVKECKTEDERINALKDFFGIVLTEEERDALSPGLRLA